MDAMDAMDVASVIDAEWQRIRAAGTCVNAHGVFHPLWALDQAEAVARTRVSREAWSDYMNRQALAEARRKSRIANGGDNGRRRRLDRLAPQR